MYSPQSVFFFFFWMTYVRVLWADKMEDVVESMKYIYIIYVE